MTDPYRLVLISIFSVLLLTCGILFYRFIYPKKKINLLVLLLLLAVLPIISLLRVGTYESGDLTINVYKSMAFYSSLLEGNLIPNWAGYLNASYGYPEFIFIYPLPYYLISLIHFLGFSFLTSTKLLITLCFVTSGTFMYLWIKEELGKISAFVAAIFYLYAPYHLVDTHFRISIGEIVSFALLPLTLFTIKKFMNSPRLNWFVLMVFSIACLILSNQAIALAALFFIILYIVFSLRNVKQKYLIYRKYFLAFALSILLTAFFWLPVIFESQYTNEKFYTEQIGFVHFHELLFSPWRYGLLFQGPEGHLSFLIGYTQLFVIVLCLYFLFKRKFDRSEKNSVLFYLSLIVLFVFLMLPESQFIWNSFALLRNFQFTYRLLLPLSLLIAFLAGIMAKKLNKKILIVLCILTILQTILNWGNRKMIPTNDAQLRSQIPYTATYEGFQPAMPKWVDYRYIWKAIPPKHHLEILKGDAEIVELKRTSTVHEYVVSVKNSEAFFKENTLYFPDWKITANHKTIPITYIDAKHSGVMYFSLKKGIYEVDVLFKQTKLRLAARVISLVTLLSLILYLLVKLLRNNIFKPRNLLQKNNNQRR